MSSKVCIYKQHVKKLDKVRTSMFRKKLAFSWEVADWNTKLRKTKNGGRGRFNA
jgi:hypothetical protein